MKDKKNKNHPNPEVTEKAWLKNAPSLHGLLPFRKRALTEGLTIYQY